MKHITWFLGLALAALALPAQAGLYYYDDFEDDTIGSAPVIDMGNDVGSGYGVPAGTVAVAANPELNGNTSAKVLGGGGTVSAPNNIVAYFNGGSKLIDTLEVSFDFYNPANGQNTEDSVRVALVGNLDTQRDVFMRNDRDTEVRIDGNIQTSFGIANFGADVWQNFTGRFTQTTPNNYNLTYVITNLETNATVGRTQAVAIAGANFTGGRARGLLLEAVEGATSVDFRGYIDNVTAIPEPSTLALVGLAGCTLVARARRWRS